MDRDKISKTIAGVLKMLVKTTQQDRIDFDEDLAHEQIMYLLAPVIEKAEKYKKALEQIERGCSFPEDDVQRAIRDVARKTLFEVPDGN
jgi:hypothetical protein